MFRKPRSGAISRKLLITLGVLAAFAALASGAWAMLCWRLNRPRAAWKIIALQDLARLSPTDSEVTRELQELKETRGQGGRPEWTGKHVLLMSDDQYLTYAFWHGANNGMVDHLFLAHGSDGRWFYSTYHFCNDMAALLWEDPPKSLTDFAARYSAREFDGKSDVCLLHTWPEKR